MASEITEQYLKIIYNLTEEEGAAKTTEIAQRLGVAPASVTQMIHKLSKQGYVRHEPYHGTRLSPKGKRVAKRIARRHRLLERFLSDIVGVGVEAGHDQACKMEHALSEEAEEVLCKMMNHPQRCPHGRPIPKCERDITCQECAAETLRLSDLDEGETATVSHLVAKNKEELCRVLAMGFIPGTRVVVEKRLPMDGPIIVNLKGTRIAIARSIGGTLCMTRAA
ncbi:MAG: metal-dependent transcriptional regulator [Methanobacteriota archaeon]|nr:MAG: metal-dependent transcriptional regulator [Euryarchaeota archaeon]